MKRYVSCFLFFLCLTMGCLLTLFVITKGVETESEQNVYATESIEEPAFADVGRTSEPLSVPGEDAVPETSAHLVLNMEEVYAKPMQDQYCLVAEEGYLLVYGRHDDDVNLFTHMPVSDFPPDEQEKLMEGIWFSTMAEIFSYLESYTS